jgi:HPt (histidine-containing phosphotransfer) domain-containing protein
MALRNAFMMWLPATAVRVAPTPAPPGGRDAAPRPEGPPGAVPSLPGIDVEGAQRRLGLDFQSLKRILVRFADGHRSIRASLRDAVNAGDAEAAARHAHAIAGAAGNLGLDELRAAARALEQAARAGGGDLAARLAEVEASAEVAFGSIESLRGAPAAAAPGGGDGRPFAAPEARAALERLRAALEESDSSAASRALSELAAFALPAAAAGELARLRSHVEGYEYEEAGALAGRLLAGIDGGAA